MKYVSLILGILAIANVMYTFMENTAATAGIFGFEVPISVYRLFWGILAIWCLYDFYRKSKKPSNTE